MALTRFTFETDGLTIEGEGVVTVKGVTPEDPAAVIVAFLELLDADTIEQAALNRQGWGDVSLTAEILGVLRDIAEGKPVAAS